MFYKVMVQSFIAIKFNSFTIIKDNTGRRFGHARHEKTTATTFD